MKANYDQHAQIIAEDIRNSMGLTFVPDEAYVASAMGQSGHGVVPGELSKYGPVVAKPHATRDRAYAEMDNLDWVAETNLPNVKVVEPIGVASSARHHILLTYREDIRPLSQLDWSVSSENVRAQRRLAKVAGRMATTAALLHDYGITHGDFKIWNMAFTPEGAPIYFDAEKTQFSEDLTRDELEEAVAHDLYSMGVSMLWNGFLEDIKDNRVRAGELSQVLLRPYFDALGHKPIVVPVSAQTYRQLETRWTNDARFRPDWVQRQRA
jgi:hypothetical protein